MTTTPNRRTVICTSTECPAVASTGRPWVGQRAASKATDSPCPKCSSAVTLVTESELAALPQLEPEAPKAPTEPPKRRTFMGVYRKGYDDVRVLGSTTVVLDRLAKGERTPQRIMAEIVDAWAQGQPLPGVR